MFFKVMKLSSLLAFKTEIFPQDFGLKSEGPSNRRDLQYKQKAVIDNPPGEDKTPYKRINTVVSTSNF